MPSQWRKELHLLWAIFDRRKRFCWEIWRCHLPRTWGSLRVLRLTIKTILRSHKEVEHDILPDLPKVGTHASSAAVKGAPKARSISGVPTGVPVMSWIIQQHDQTVRIGWTICICHVLCPEPATGAHEQPAEYSGASTVGRACATPAHAQPALIRSARACAPGTRACAPGTRSSAGARVQLKCGCTHDLHSNSVHHRLQFNGDTGVT